MAHQLISSFTRYHLTDEELKSAQTLTTTNIQFLQNLICDAAEARLALTFDPANPMVFIQREAELQGQIGILKALISFSSSPESN